MCLGKHLILPNLEKNMDMYYYQKISSSILVAILSLFGTAAMAQGNMGGGQGNSYSDEEVDKFIVITKEIQTATTGIEDKVNTLLEKHGLAMETFQRMAQTQQMGGDLSSFSAEEQAAYKAMEPEIETMQKGAMMNMNTILKKHDMDMMTYQQMAMSIQQDPAMKAKVQGALKPAEEKEEEK